MRQILTGNRAPRLLGFDPPAVIGPGSWWIVIAAVVAVSPPGVCAQSSRIFEDPFAATDLGTDPHAEMSALMEVTIFNIDVLTLTVRVGRETGEVLRGFADPGRYGEALADSVAAVILRADDLWARQVLHRDVSYGRMLDGMRETSKRAAEAGYVTWAFFEEFSESLPALFGFLEEEGARKGDEVFFLVRGDTVRTLYRAVDGTVLLDRSTAGSEARRGSIPSFFAPRTRFRKRLVESLLNAGSS